MLNTVNSTKQEREGIASLIFDPSLLLQFSRGIVYYLWQNYYYCKIPVILL